MAPNTKEDTNKQGWASRSCLCSEERSTHEEMDWNEQRFGFWIQKSWKKSKKSLCFVINATNSPNCKSTPSVINTHAYIRWLGLWCYIHNCYMLGRDLLHQSRTLCISKHHQELVSRLPSSVSTLVSDVLFPRMPLALWSTHDGVTIMSSSQMGWCHLCDWAQAAVSGLGREPDRHLGVISVSCHGHLWILHSDF